MLGSYGPLAPTLVFGNEGNLYGTLFYCGFGIP